MQGVHNPSFGLPSIKPRESHDSAPDIFFSLSVSYWSNLKPVSNDQEWFFGISIHGANDGFKCVLLNSA